MPENKFNYKDVLSRILICPEDGRTKSAQNFWRKETVLYKKLYKKYPNENFWKTLSLFDTNCTNGRIKTLAFFLDKKCNYWPYILLLKWKRFNYKPPKHVSYIGKRDMPLSTPYQTKYKSLRKFLS